MRRSRPLLALAVLLPLLADTRAADSPQFRGPDGTGVCTDARPPAEWDAARGVAWKVAVPGVAWSCPVVVGDRVFVTTAFSPGQPKPTGGFGGGKGGGKGGSGGTPKATYQFKVVCLDRATGRPRWEKVAKEARPTVPTHGSNTYATETPVTDGERVYAYFGMTGLFCYDLDGKEVWAKDLGSYPMQAGWGTASSPVLAGDRLVVQCDNEEKSFLVALDETTGKELWRAGRPERSGWSTPFVWRTKGRTDLVAAGGQKVRGYDPAGGRVVWELDVGGGQCLASPVGEAERLYVGVGQGGVGWAARRAAGAGPGAPRARCSR